MPTYDSPTGLAADPNARAASNVDDADFAAAPPGLRRLTTAELESSLDDLLDHRTRTVVEPDVAVAGFSSVGASSAGYSEVGIERLVDLASEASEAALLDPARREALLGCAPADLSDPCVDQFLPSFGRRAWRRPLDSDEVERYQNLAATASRALDDPWRGLATAVAGLISSPNFAYRVELGRPSEGRSEWRKYTGYEMATRLSYTIWGSTPDDTLLDAAARGRLDNVSGVLEQVERLLDSPRASDGIGRFFGEYWRTSNLLSLDRNPDVFPEFSPGIARAMGQEITFVMVDAALDETRDLRTVFTTPVTHVNGELARFYGVTHPGDDEFRTVVPETGSQRWGVLTLGGFLAANARPSRTSPTLRGRFIRSRILCDEVPNPPPGVDTTVIEESDETLTLRDRLEQHRADPTCATCHDYTDPLGFAFEHFDGVGAYRETEAGLPIDASGELDGARFDGARELQLLLAETPRLTDCMTTQLYRYVTGRLEQPGDSPVLELLSQAFANSGHSFRTLLAATLASDGVRYAAPLE